MEDKVSTIKQMYLAQNIASEQKFIEVITEFSNNLIGTEDATLRILPKNCKEHIIALKQYKLNSNTGQMTEKQQRPNPNLDNCLEEKIKVTHKFISPYRSFPSFYDEQLNKIFQNCSEQSNSVESGLNCVNQMTPVLKRVLTSKIANFDKELNKL